ncbi:MAG: TetR family transcriptional regulator [Deltaproteobacteria bacterium]|nr:TetR family transcriptional regulator [Deltaproteobacteria bacterium]MBW2415059.1 TetR family transcriptional regulator [Deltaproteobacteria bacterium]
MKTKEKILGASLDLMNRKGFAGVTVADIAARAGISTGNLSYHFPTKADLVRALWERSAADHLEQAVDWAPESVLDECVGWIRSLCRVMWTHRFLYRDRSQYQPLAPELSRRTRETLVDRGRREVRRVLDVMREAGHLTASDDDLDLVATNMWIVLRYWIDHLAGTHDLRRMERRHVDDLAVHFTGMIRPYLTAGARRDLATALAR